MSEIQTVEKLNRYSVSKIHTTSDFRHFLYVYFFKSYFRELKKILGESDKYKFSEDNPFIDPEDEEENGPSPVASVGYRYRLWDLVSITSGLLP